MKTEGWKKLVAAVLVLLGCLIHAKLCEISRTLLIQGAERRAVEPLRNGPPFSQLVR